MKLKEINSGFLAIRQEEFHLCGQSLATLVQETLRKGSCIRLTANGFSMLPFIRDGDVVTVSASPGISLVSGRVIAFIHPQTARLVIHRLLGRDNGCYLVKGDSVFSADGLIPGKSILGCVTKIERNGRRVSFGLGPERRIIAFLSRKVLPWVFRCWGVMPTAIRSTVKCLVRF